MSYDAVNFPEGSVFLITGGAGFIGSNLAEALLKKGMTVRVLDNLSTGKMANVDIFAADPHYTFIKGDIRDLDTCMAACEGADYVLHQAAMASVPESVEKPLDYCENNIRGTLNMLEAARRQGVKRFVYASSSAVYGDAASQPQKEGQEGNMLSPYALSKQCDEEWAKQYTMHFGLPTVGLRYFNVFGKRQDPEGAYAAVIPCFIKLLLAGKRPVIYGDGGQTRDFTYVENVVEANLRACAAGEEAFGQAFNVACGDKAVLNDVFYGLTSALGLDTEPVYAPERPGDIRHSSADITKARTLLGYDPSWDFRKGIAEAIAWYKENL